MATLSSPGVSVTVDDQSAYSSNVAGTVPLIVIGTADYKSKPNGTDVATGTIPTNANKLYTITSQRDLVSTFGNPIFYSKDGVQKHGYELNEYGLHAAYQFLGINNKAYIVRSNIDYSSLAPSYSEPTSEPVSDTYWFDIKKSSFGVFESNGGSVPGTAWKSQSVTLIDQDSQIDIYIKATVAFSNPTTNTAISASGNLVINGTSVSLASGDTLQGVVTKINAASITNITAYLYELGGYGYLLIKNTGLNGKLVITNTSTSSILNDLGLISPGTTTYVPKTTIGNDGDYAIITVYNDNIIYQKLTPEGIGTSNDILASSFWFIVGSVDWKKATPTRLTGSNNPVLTSLSSQVFTISTGTASNTQITITMGSSVTTVDEVVTQTNSQIQTLLATLTSTSPQYNSASNLVATKSGSAFELVNRSGDDIYVASSGTILTDLGMSVSVKGSELYYSPHYSIPSNSVSGDVWIKTTQYNSGSSWVVKVYSTSTSSWTTVSVPLYSNDTLASTGYGSNLTTGVLYVQYNLYGTSTDPVASAKIKYYNGTAWETLIYEASESAPTSEATVGTYWFNDNYRVDIMINDGDQWKGYLNYAGNTNTDPSGVIIAGSTPTTQLDGTALVDNDLWIDSSDTENYPKLYRYTSSTKTWKLIDKTDQTTPFGILFADARWNVDGSESGNQSISSLLSSDYVDPDVPDPRLYPDGMLLFNTRYSYGNVKEWRPSYLSGEYEKIDFTLNNYTVGASTFDPVPYSGRWVSKSGARTNGWSYFGRKAQRNMIVEALAETFSSNEDIRAETVYFNVISCPGYPELIDEMITLNTDKKEVAFIIGDTPFRLSPDSTSVVAWATNANSAASNSDEGLTSASPYVGIYYPPAGLTTNINGTEIMIPSSSIGLRTLAYSDNQSYVWFAPAGYQRGLVTNAKTVGYLSSENEFVVTILNQGQRDVLYENNINPIAYIPNRGLIVFGQKTLNPINTAMDRINVARLTNYLRYNLDIIAQPFLFQQNDQTTRDQFKKVIENFLSSIVSQRGLYDYVVVCDTTNNTSTTIDLNELIANIAIQPEKSIEFIYIPITIVNSSVDLSSYFS